VRSEITLLPNLAPTSTKLEAVGVEDEVFTGQLLATDPDGNSLTFEVGASFGGTVSTLPNGQFTFTPNANFAGTASFWSRARDQYGAYSAWVLNTIAFAPVNDPPIINDQAFVIDEGAITGTLVGYVQVIDPERNFPLTGELVSGLEDGAIFFNPFSGGIYVVHPELLDYETQPTRSFVVRIFDSEGLSTTATITVQLRDIQLPANDGSSKFVSENSPSGTSLGYIFLRSIPEPGQVLQYEIVGDTSGGKFLINSATGEVTLAPGASINYEEASSYSLTVRVSDVANPALFHETVHTVSVGNRNDAPVISSDSFSVAENTPNGSVVGTVIATDEDANQTLTYSISGASAAGAFAINGSTGEITVADASLLDFESGQSVMLTISVTDNGNPNPALTTTREIVIHLTDVNEAPVIADQSFAVAENSLNTNRVGFVTGSDVDAGASLTYSITSSSLPGAFAINPVTGEVTVTDGSLLDFEAVTSATLVITATDNGTPALSANATVTVAITDVNELPIIVDQNYTVAENAADGTVVGTVIAGDVDAGQALTYSISHSAPISGAFAIDAVTGQITVANGSLLNFEGVSAIALTVTVTDNGNPELSHSAIVLVTLTDVNEAPVITDQSFTVAENSLNTNPVGFVTGSDVDAGQSLTYSITSTSLPGAFAIDAVTGEVTVADGSLLDFEVVTSATLVITATDNGNPALSANATVTVAITDVNERPIIVDQNFTVAENAASGTVVGTVVSSDVDAGQSRTYAITASAPVSGAFAINATTGEITVVDGSLLNFEAISAVALTVTVTDDGNPALSSSAVVVVSLTDVNEAPAIADQSFTVAENSASGTIVGSIIASDVDGGQSLAYAITGSTLAGAFAIDATSGQMTVANAALLNFEAVTSVTLTVTATDNGNPALSSSALVTISLTNVNEAPTIANQSFSVAENSANATIVGDVTASDVDAGQSLSYSIAAGNTGGAFAINAATGRITVANTAALNFETNPSFALTVRVTDSGNPALSSTATVTINLTDVIEAIIIGLDVVPGDATNTVKLNSRFNVAILSTATFDARTLRVNKIRFGKTGTEDSITRDKDGDRVYSYRDVNGDGRLDLVVNITTSRTGLTLSDTLVRFSGLTNSGLQVLGSSSVRVRR
jgi:VCBS repeat-containing protein